MELKETLNQMVSDDYRERFKAEYYQIKIRVQRLGSMIDKYERGELKWKPTCSFELLAEQLKYMNGYKSILENRAELEHIELIKD